MWLLICRVEGNSYPSPALPYASRKGGSKATPQPSPWPAAKGREQSYPSPALPLACGQREGAEQLQRVPGQRGAEIFRRLPLI